MPPLLLRQLLLLERPAACDMGGAVALALAVTQS